jgi:hypothetical protein
MPKLTSFLAGAAVGAAVGAAAGAALRPHLRTIAKTAITSYYVGKRHAVELAARVAEDLEDLHAEVLNEREAAAAGTVTADAAVSTSAAASTTTAATCEVEPEPEPEPKFVDEEVRDEMDAKVGGMEASCDDSQKLEGMTVRQLRDELVRLGIEIGTRVKKSELIERLQTFAASATSTSTTPTT